MGKNRRSVSVSGVVLGGAVAVVLAGGAWYVAQLRTEIDRLTAEKGRELPARAPARVEAPLQGGRTIGPEQRKAMLEKLGGAGVSTQNPVWFATMPNNPEVAAYQRAIQSVFEEAGWQMRGNVPVTFSLKAGIFVFSADEEPPDYVESALSAFEAAGITVTAGRGYRAFYAAKKQENPNWRGFDMAADQTYVVVIGRKPEEQKSEK